MYVIIAIALLSAAGLGWYLLYGGEDEEDADDLGGPDALSITAADGSPLSDALATTANEELEITARESRMVALKASLQRSLDSREGKAQMSAKDRMTMPWFLFVGADGSGKKTILANTGLPLPWGPPLEVDSHRKDAGKWWLFEQAVVLEAPPTSPGTTAVGQTLPPDQTVADASVGWNTLLHMLRRERPDAPLNGIIVTISCADLMSARNNPERMEEQADRINNFLTRTRNFLGVRLPLHVLVTKCDTLPGFRSFADALPESRRHDIFGWANPNDPEMRFDPAWIDNGFTHLHAQVADLRDEVLAAPELVRDSVGVFVFDTEFADLQDTLKTFVGRILTAGERRPTLFFRGFYFTGDAMDESESGSKVETTLSEAQPRSTTRMSTEIPGEAHSLVFLRSLFSDKIFKEAGLGRPMSRWRLSRDRRVVAAQAAALVIALVGGAGLWMSVNGFRRAERVYQPGLKTEAEQLTRVLSGVAIDLDEVRRGNGPGSPLDRRARDAAVLELVAQMRDVPSMGVRSPFIPSSWFSPLPGDIRESMMTGIETIVLPVTRQRLEERAARLLGTSEDGTAAGSVALSADEFDATDPRSLTSYLTDVRTLSRNIARYNSLADSTSGNVAELWALLDYLFGEQISSDSGLATSDFEDALKHASGPRIVVPPAIAATVVNRAVGMVSALGEQAARQLTPRSTPAAERAIRPGDDLAALNGLAALVRLMDPKEGVVATVSDSAILGIPLARVVEDSIAARFRRLALLLVRDSISHPDSSAARLRGAIERLYGYRMMDRTEGGSIAADIRANERLRWDIGRLELALALPSEFQQAVATIAEALPRQGPERMRRAVAVQLRARSIDVAASAQRFTAVTATGDPLQEVRSAGLNLDAAAPRLVRLAQSFDTLQAAPEGRRLLAAGARQAEHALAEAQRIFDGWSYFSPQTGKIAAWVGHVPLSAAALGIPDSTERVVTLIRYTSDVRSLGAVVSPAIRYLRQPGLDSVRMPALVSRWDAIVTAAQRYERGEASSTLGMLVYFVRDGMGMTDLAACTARASEPDTTKPSSDVFVIRRRQFRAALVSRCGTGGATEAVASYQRLRTLFQTRLAGRYPFVDTTVTTRAAGEAEPTAVREFFRQYDAFRIVHDVALRSHPSLSQTARAAIAFIDQLAPVRAFAAPFADSGSVRTSPAYSLLANAISSADSLPTFLLDLDVGGRQGTIEDTPQEHMWRAGDSVKVILSPLDTAQARTLYTAGGAWAGLRFAQRPPAGVRVRVYHPDTKIELAMPVFPGSAPEILIPRSR